VVRPGSDRWIFSVDSGIRLRRRKKSAIEARPNPAPSIDGIRARNIQIKSLARRPLARRSRLVWPRRSAKSRSSKVELRSTLPGVPHFEQ
jgi:hypothetical protein